MDENISVFEQLKEALAAVGMAHLYREERYIKPGQSWHVIEQGVSVTITRHSDGLYSYPVVSGLDPSRYQKT